MAGWRQLLRGCRALFRRSEAERDIADEVQHYLDEAAAAHRARGLGDGEARRAARIEIGGVTGVNEQVRGYGWENGVRGLFGDLRYAARGLRAAPGFTVVTVITLALGIGATTAIFSAIYPILIQPLPYPDGHRIATIWELSADGQRMDGSYGMFHAMAERTHAFQSLAVFKPWLPTMTGSDQPERLTGQRVTSEYFRVLGVAPALGRDFLAADDRPQGPRVVILGDRLWRRRFAADPAIIGRDITLSDTQYTVIGVMPARFENVLGPEAEIWGPMQYGLSEGRTWGHHLRTVGRLRDGSSITQAAREAATLGPAILKDQRPETYAANAAFTAVALRDDVTRAVKPALIAVLIAVTLVLLIACVNVTNLLLARGVQRRGELALRAALGAGKGRLIRQLLTESVLLSVLGGLAGMLVAWFGLRALHALSPADLPRAHAIAFNPAVFAFGLALTTVLGLAVGTIPALHAARSDPHDALQHGSNRSTGTHGRIRASLVVAEVALALVLLVGSGLLLRSLQQLFAVPAGFEASHLLTMQVQTAGQRFNADGATVQFFTQVLDAVRRVPGVTTVALTSQLPMSGDDSEYGLRLDGSQDGSSTFRYAVTPGYIETMGIPLLYGRSLDERDRAGSPPVALVNESLAKSKFGGRDAIGQRVHIGPTDRPPYTIVGVVGDVRQMSLALGPPDAVYTTSSQWIFTDPVMSLVVRGQGNVASLAPAIRAAVWSVDKDQPVVRIATMDELLAASAAERRYALILFETFAIVALALAAAGIYGVIAGRVAERTREIGVRAALGATRGSILRLVLGEGFTLTAFGIGIGVAASAAAGRGMSALLFNVSPLDPVTHASVLMLLLVVAAVACAVPAWRAVRVDPATTLRAE